MALSPVQTSNSIWNTALANLISYDDLPTLWSQLYDALATYIDVSSLSFIIYRKDALPQALFNQATDDAMDSRIGAYVKGAYLLDPFYRACMYEKQQGICMLQEISPQDFEDSQYYQTFFSAYGLYDEINIFNWPDDRTAIAISLGRPKGERRFGQNSLVRLREIEPLLSAISLNTWEKHQETPDTSDSADVVEFHHRLKNALERFGTSVLTAREKDVLDHLLRGYSVKSAAVQLGITAGTVRIHRHSVYEKLDIGSQTELFALILECLKQTSDDMDVDPLLRMLPPDY